MVRAHGASSALSCVSRGKGAGHAAGADRGPHRSASGSPEPQRCPGLDSGAGAAGPLRGRGWGSAVSGAWSESASHCPLRQHFDTDTQDLAGIEWAPNGCVLAAWDTCLEVRRPFPRAWCSPRGPGSPRRLCSSHPSSSRQPLLPAPACLPRPPRPLQSLSAPAPGDLAFLSS